MKRKIALIYWIFKTDKKQTTPYFSTGLIVLALLILPFFIVSFSLNLSLSFFQFIELPNKKAQSWINTILCVTPLLLLFFFLYKRKQLEAFEFSNTQIRKGRKLLIATMIILICLLAISAFKLVIEQD